MASLIHSQGTLLGCFQPSDLLASFGIHSNTHVHISWTTSHTAASQPQTLQGVGPTKVQTALLSEFHELHVGLVPCGLRLSHLLPRFSVVHKFEEGTLCADENVEQQRGLQQSTLLTTWCQLDVSPLISWSPAQGGPSRF